MSTDLSKLCADYLRAFCSTQTSSRLKASHARELVAAFFGYKSHAALLSEKHYPLEHLEDASLLVPDILLLEQRRSRLSRLPADIPDSLAVANALSAHLQRERHFVGDVWLCNPVEDYVVEQLLAEHDLAISDDISGVTAQTNASFDHLPYYEHAQTQDTPDALIITATGVLQGTPLDDKPFSGDTIDLFVTVTLPRVAGKRAFSDVEIDASGSVNDDWRDNQMHYETPRTRPKQQWLQMTGGFRFGETTEQFNNRQVQIHAIRNRIAQGNATEHDVSLLSRLLGADDDVGFHT